MKPNCYIDFDGTIVDNKFRLFQFVRDNLPSKLKNPLTIDAFWDLKRQGINEADHLNDNFGANIDINEWNRKKFAVIESDVYLKYDRLFDFSIEALTILRNTYDLILVSRRERESGLRQQLARSSLMDFFEDIIVLKHGGITKAEAIRSRYTVSKDDILIGDTEDDICSGENLGIKTYFVLSGIRDKWIMKTVPSLDHTVVVENISILAHSVRRNVCRS